MLQDIYKSSLLPLIFKRLGADPETAHNQTLKILTWLTTDPTEKPYWAQPTRRFAQAWLQSACSLSSPRLAQTLWGLAFANPVGLAAGFDKDGAAIQAWPGLGFGFIELGTVTFHAQSGNPQPRLFRLPDDRAALNRMGFNNRGAAKLAERLLAGYVKEYPIPLGVNLGKSKVTPLEQAARDYRQSFDLLKDLGRYFVVNVSSPNTPGLRSLQSKTQLAPILEALQSVNQGHKPLLVKISPDLAWADIDDILALIEPYQLAGIIATNTTIARTGLSTHRVRQTGSPVTQTAGGISGAPVRQRSTEVIRYIYQRTQGQVPIIGVGGVFTADDAWDKITAGASLVQVYTGWVYEGPWMVKKILQGLLGKLDEAGLETISEAVGIGH
ncbi:MAG: quinone-dependent dihydroorotate dehydrogenase [Cyanobacteria bacterium P01_A01_bin.114]